MKTKLLWPFLACLGLLLVTSLVGGNAARTPVHAQSPEWDYSGLYLVKDITPGDTGTQLGEFRDVNGTLFFVVHRGSHDELWKSSGKEETTVMLKAATGHLQGLFTLEDDTLLFWSGECGISHYELWKADGTPDGTALVWTAPPEVCVGKSIKDGSALWFTAHNTQSDTDALWRVDGTSSSVLPGYSWGLANVNDTIFFFHPYWDAYYDVYRNYLPVLREMC